MPQTLLALLSVMLVSLFSYNQQRNVLSMRANMLRDEVALQATAVAVDRLDEIGAKAFDEATRSDAVSASNQLSAMLSVYEGEQVSPGFASDSPSDDIDDFDNVTVYDSRSTWLDSLDFKVHTEVTYVSEADRQTEVSYQTRFKKVTAQVYSMDYALADTFYLSQVYNCGTLCNW